MFLVTFRYKTKIEIESEMEEIKNYAFKLQILMVMLISVLK